MAKNVNETAAYVINKDGGRRRGMKLVKGEWKGFYWRYDEPGGKTIVIRCSTLAEADEAVREHNESRHLDKKYEIGLKRKSDRIAFVDAVAEFVQIQTKVAKSTAVKYACHLGRFVYFVQSERLVSKQFYLDEPNGHILDQFWGYLREEFCVDPEAPNAVVGLSEPTVFTHFITMRKFFKWCVEKRAILDRNPMHQCSEAPSSNPRKYVRRRPNICDADIEALIEACETEDQRIMIWLACRTGRDRVQLARITRTDIDWDLGAFIGTREKTQNPINVPIPPYVLGLLRKHAEGKSPTERLLKGVLRQGMGGPAWMRRSAPVSAGEEVVAKRSKPRTYADADWFVRVREKAGRPDIWFCDFRAVAARTAVALSGNNAKAAANLLGHDEETVTMTFYLKADPELAAKLNALPLPGLKLKVA